MYNYKMIRSYFFCVFIIFIIPAGAFADDMKHNDQSIAIDVSSVISLPDVIARVSGKKIVYVGENHDRFSNHASELEVIKTLYEKNKKIAIGMEMFQKPFQKVLDEYIAGAIDERAMLKGTEYFKRWGFDYNLYRPILVFAREKGIPVIALNIRREITEKVSREGIGSLPSSDIAELPSQIDLSDESYKERLHEVFQKHDGQEKMNFEFFYMAQVLWDESMSQAIDDFLKSNPDFPKDGCVVILAGNGHLAFGSGIPRRTFKRNGLGYAVILNDMDLEKDIADYLVYPAPVEGITAPKIMAVLKDDQGIIAIKGFPENSISEKAGLAEGDIIVSFDDVPVTSVDDIRVHLLYKKKGDPMKIKIRRKRFLFGDTEKEFTVIL